MVTPPEVIISADSHVFEPVDLWDKRIDKRFKDRGPRFVHDYQGQAGTWFVCEGATPRSVASIAAVGIPKEELVKFAGAHYSDLRPGGYDAVERLKDQDIDGVSAEVLYPTYAMGLYAVPDAALQEAAFDAYNDWLTELCGHAPNRLAGLALISVRNVDHAVQSIQRWRRAGLRGAMISCVPPEGTEYSDACYEPMWATFEELGIPVSIHTLTSSRGQKHRFDRSKRGAASYPENPLEVMLTLGELTTFDLLDRHPRLKLVLAEADIGWMPWMLARLDRGHDRWAKQNGIATQLKPSEYFHRNFSAAFIQDRVGVFTREFTGVDNLMWSSDYPHTDSTWPHSRASIEHDFEGVGEAERRKMTCTNAARLYGFEVAG
jgi:predicted TIM-barrel fold metal-dependent hydrolase